MSNINLNLQNLNKAINPLYYPYLKDKMRYFVCYGGAGSGKSVFIAQKILIRIMVGFKKDIKHKFICLRKTMPSARKSIWSLFKNLISDWGLEDIVKYNKSDLTITFFNGSQIIIGGLDDPEKLKSIHGITSAWLEEASEMTLDDFLQVNLRIRGRTPSYKQIMLSFNPISKLLWLYDYFFENSTVASTILHSTYKDNMFLDKQYCETLEALIEQDPTYYQIYAKGEWGVLKNIIYSNWKSIDDFPDYEDMKDFCFGLDFGFTAPSSLVLLAKKENDLFAKELIRETKLTNDDLIEKIKETIPKKYWRKKIIYADHAEPARIEEINRAGLICKKADKSVKDGLDYCKRLKINVDSNSPDMIKEFQSYKYREKDGQPIDGEPVKFNDHSMDSLRYGAYTHWGKLRPKGEILFL